MPGIALRKVPGMAKTRKTSNALPRTVTADRARRLYRMLQMLETEPQTRKALLRRLHLDVRGFYRDLELLRAAGIEPSLTEGRYALPGKAADVLHLLPFPDPGLTLGEAQQLAKGRSTAHRKLKQQIGTIVR